MIVTVIIIPCLLILSLVLALIKKKDAFAAFCKGASEGLKLTKEIIPSVLAMISAVSILKCSGLIDDIGSLIGKAFNDSEFITNIVPMAFFRPISGNASLAILNSVCKVGPDSLSCITASLIQGSTDTTFYVIALYFSSIKITKWRHTLKAALFADFVGIVLAITFALIIFK
ncbi:MAG: spore maturation protein [Candidatus Caccosoma sp.]|mgnify:FL=1|nr:spore maturation protein [Candidatus Caccosoma sp.]